MAIAEQTIEVHAESWIADAKQPKYGTVEMSIDGKRSRYTASKPWDNSEWMVWGVRVQMGKTATKTAWVASLHTTPAGIEDVRATAWKDGWPTGATRNWCRHIPKFNGAMRLLPGSI